jgi:hypothetical protein
LLTNVYWIRFELDKANCIAFNTLDRVLSLSVHPIQGKLKLAEIAAIFGQRDDSQGLALPGARHAGRAARIFGHRREGDLQVLGLNDRDRLARPKLERGVQSGDDQCSVLSSVCGRSYAPPREMTKRLRNSSHFSYDVVYSAP